MVSRRWIVLLCCAVLMGIVPIAIGQTPTPPPEGEPTTYTVRSGDTLSSIATRLGVSLRAIVRVNRIVDPDRLAVGQVLIIPTGDNANPETPAATDSAPTADSSPTPDSPAIAVESSTDPTPDATSGETIAADAQTILPTSTPEPLPPLAFGLALFTSPDGINADSALAVALGAQWVALPVRWDVLEPAPSAVDYANLDLIVSTLEARSLSILVTVSGAPAWARSTPDESGPPDDLNAYATFVGGLAARYAGRIAAYEIWHEPNLRREWNSSLHPIGAASYRALFAPAYAAIKTADPAAQVITAGLAPTGLDDGFNAVNDRRFLYELVTGGLQADGIGAHPYGFATPPDLPCCDAPPDVPTHFGDPSFYFATTLTSYRDITAMTGLPLWVTAFGWGTTAAPDLLPRNAAYIAYNSPEEQAAYTLAALDLAPTYAPVRVMILSNLNGCASELANPEACYLAVNRLDAVQPPIFDALRARTLSAPSG